MFWVTARGSGVSPDSTVYIGTAKSLLAGKGFYSGGAAMTHFPPVYPLLLAAAGTVFNNLTQASRVLDALFFGANAMLIASSIYIYTGHSPIASMCAVLWFLTSVAMLDIHSMAWSEPPFLGFSLAALLLVSRHIESPRFGLLVPASIFLGLAMTTRYLGVTLLPPMLIGVLCLGDRSIRSRLRDSFVVCAIGCAPLAFWLLRNVTVAQTATSRKVALHPVTVSHIESLLLTMHDLFVPIPYLFRMKVFELGLVSALFIAVFSVWNRVRGWREHDVAAVSQILNILFCITYVTFLLVSVSLFDAATPLDTRMLSPVFAVLLLAIISLCWNAAKTARRPLVWYGCLIFWFLSVTTNVIHAIPLATQIHGEGRGYTSSMWTESDTVRYIRSLPFHETMYSNGPDSIQFLTGKEAVWIPRRVDSATLIPNHQFEKEMKTMCGALTQQGAVLVYLRNFSFRWYLPTEEDVRSACRLSVRVHLTDGTVYEKLN
jgi:hypothetical protein